MIRGLFLDVLNQSITACYLIAAIIAARILLKRAPKSVCCILWMLVGIRLIMPFSVQSAFSLMPSGAQVQNDIRQITGTDTAVYQDETAQRTASFAKTDYLNEETIRELGYNNNSPESINRPFVYFSIASAVWLAGMGIMLLYFMISWFCLRRRVRMAVPKQQGAVKYYQCEMIDTPFLFGLVKPRIYVPLDLCGTDLDYVLKHETAREKRRDYLIKPIGYLLLTIYWFHPFVWAAYLLLCRDIELACDERVIRTLGTEEKKAYSLALLTCAVNHRAIAACPVAFGEIGVKGRVKNVLCYKKPTLWVIAAAFTVVAVVTLCFMTEKTEADAAQNGNRSNQFIMVNEADHAKMQTAQTMLRQSGEEIINTEIKDMGDAQDRTQAEVTAHSYFSNEGEYVKQWAEAFCSRDGQTIIELTEENLREELSDTLGLSWGVDDNNKPYAAFGWSSPWPWGGDENNYRILSASEDKAVILYYAWVSDPHVTVWREELSYTVQDGKFQVTSQQLQFLDGICIADEFYAAYPDGVINGTMMDYYAYNDAGETLNSNAKNTDMALSGYAELDQPDTAAISLLNILRNENKVTVNVEYTNAQETQAVVTFAFLEDASTAKVRMIKPYGEDSIWLPQTY